LLLEGNFSLTALNIFGAGVEANGVSGLFVFLSLLGCCIVMYILINNFVANVVNLF
jgi:hypothetical protein